MGYSFYAKKDFDPKGANHLIELLECEPWQFKVVDQNQKPVAGAEFIVHTATPKEYSYFGSPDGAKVVTDKDGKASYVWAPKIANVHIYLESASNQWGVVEKTINDHKLEIVVSKRERKTVA